MDINDLFNMFGQGGGPRDETEVKKTILQDGQESRVLGGKARREVINDAKWYEEERDNLLMADDGVITTTDPADPRYPWLLGKDFQGNYVSVGNLHRCMEKGCNRRVSNLSGVECQPGIWRCNEHYKRYDLRKFIKWLLAPFYKFRDEDLQQTLPVVSEEDSIRERE